MCVIVSIGDVHVIMDMMTSFIDCCSIFLYSSFNIGNEWNNILAKGLAYILECLFSLR